MARVAGRGPRGMRARRRPRIARRRAAAAGRAPRRRRSPAPRLSRGVAVGQGARLLVRAAEPLPGLSRRPPVAGDLERERGRHPVRRRVRPPARQRQKANSPATQAWRFCMASGRRRRPLLGARRVADQPGGLGAGGADRAMSGNSPHDSPNCERLVQRRRRGGVAPPRLEQAERDQGSPAAHYWRWSGERGLRRRHRRPRASDRGRGGRRPASRPCRGGVVQVALGGIGEPVGQVALSLIEVEELDRVEPRLP